MQSELKRLTRSERTHRLCTRAGMLESFLKEPTVLTDEDVMELLAFIFQSEAVQKKLNLLIESRRETQEADESRVPIKQYLQKFPKWERFGVTSVTPFLLLPVHPEGCTPARRT